MFPNGIVRVDNIIVSWRKALARPPETPIHEDVNRHAVSRKKNESQRKPNFREDPVFNWLWIERMLIG